MTETAAIAKTATVGDPPSATLTIHRRSPRDAKQRQVIMSLDGRELATLMYGQRATRTIPAGRHFLRAYNTLVWKTYDFTAAPGDDIHVTVINRAAPGMLWLVALLGAGPMTVSIEPTKPEDQDEDKAPSPPTPSPPK
jgi:hypothetical protein